MEHRLKVYRFTALLEITKTKWGVKTKEKENTKISVELQVTTHLLWIS